MIKWFEKHNKLSWVITILIAVIIFYFSTLSFGGGFGGKYTTNWVSIVYHIVIFFILSIFLFIALIKGKHTNLFFFSILVLISYGILDELHQFFVPARFCTISDVGFDMIGILFAFMVYLIYLRSNKVVINQQKL